MNAQLQGAALRYAIVRAISEDQQVPVEDLRDETSFESLGVDSLEFMNVMLVVGNAVGKDVPQERLPECHTVGDVVRILAEC